MPPRRSRSTTSRRPPREDGETLPFAEAVRRAARNLGHHGRGFGGKVLVSRVFRELSAYNPSLTMPDFKASLLEAHRAGDLSLSRADMSQLFDARELDSSEIEVPGFHRDRPAATFHLLGTGEE